MSENRPPIPEPIKRKVRQQCGFGCAICGMPFFQYDHIEEYADVQEHNEGNLVLLCPNHHAAKTTKKLSKERIREAKVNPFNNSRASTSVYKVEPSRELITQLGSNVITGWHTDGKSDHNTVWVNGKSFLLIHSDEGQFTISIDVTDEKGNILLSVKKGELVVSTAAWDYVYEGENIKIRAALGEVILDLNLSDKKIEIVKGMFIDKNLDGFSVQDGSLKSICAGNSMSTIRNCRWPSSGFGGWGILNSASVPNVSIPQGVSFAVFTHY
ncbi:HNH endonuclease signature motif containing protein [Kosakonia sp. BYX6]|uniref:HNH endonuclease signature motif containing protein n=1 Tax=Kosakonia calanthes TaxID=3139408 RepID=A0ABZ3BCH2_9ENTR